jgi:aminoglycoside 3-N-acetyltransferase
MRLVGTTPVTGTTMVRQLWGLGLRRGQVVLVHTSLSRLGWVCGGAQTVIEALLEVLGPQGTLMMPTHTSDNSDPAHWSNPPVPESWWQTIREQTPPYDPRTSPTRGMGAVAELFRTWPGVQRSAHPQVSFAALGPHADYLVDDHVLEEGLGERSPLGRLYALDGRVLLLGTGHEHNTSLHLSEHRAAWPGKRWHQEGAAVWEGGQRRWRTFETLEVDPDDFGRIGAAWEASEGAVGHFTRGEVGQGQAILMRQRALVEFGTRWMSEHRR